MQGAAQEGVTMTDVSDSVRVAVEAYADDQITLDQLIEVLEKAPQAVMDEPRGELTGSQQRVPAVAVVRRVRHI